MPPWRGLGLWPWVVISSLVFRRLPVVVYGQRIFSWRLVLLVALEEDGLVLLPFVWSCEGLSCHREAVVVCWLVGPATSWVSGYRSFGAGVGWLVPCLSSLKVSLRLWRWWIWWWEWHWRMPCCVPCFLGSYNKVGTLYQDIIIR